MSPAPSSSSTPAVPAPPRAGTARWAAGLLTAGLLALLGALGPGLAGTSAASAHGAAPTMVVARLGAASTATAPVVRLVARVPLDRLDLAYGTTFAQAAAADGLDRALLLDGDAITDLLLARVTLRAADGVSWTLRATGVTGASVEGSDAARVVLVARPSTGAGGDELTDLVLTWGLITDVIVTHDVYVGAVGTDGTTSLVATLTQTSPSTDLSVTLPEATSTSMLGVGFAHFRSGADHLLLLCLLALGVARQRTGATGAAGGRPSWRTTAGRLALLTLTFTLGHSVSLALAATGVVDLPSRWVETAIAVTILLTAVHAVRPVLAWRWELALTAAFGLVHGLGFAGALGELDLRGTDLLVPLLTFNLGLEAAQLLALALVLGPLLVLARSRAATVALAVVVGVVAASWVVARATGLPDVLGPVTGVLLATPERLALQLAAAALAVLALRHAPTDGPTDLPTDPATEGHDSSRALCSLTPGSQATAETYRS
ncbi:HupE/UreJ family protein [Nocardioides sp. GY 10127]|uniref:HupE/UreJ family protein n=1 Tax=Nocardioides sp. GY 10127 TaxID=2569762 RepID=UPI0010A827D0|nr:HupE/UreJ family protein [Nocardioides sp. GY 10127]TIC81758.1 HupE/UreJ family protein [Nocardioides sp. GY 10127]